MKAVVAMSGGVDSSVAALLLHDQGHDIVGVSLQVWDYRNHGGSRGRATCCAPKDFDDARSVAGRCGFPYYVFDVEDSFRTEVINRFVSSYQQGETPNPCIDCNRKVKFGALLERASSLGRPVVATGHYARVVRDGEGTHLLRGRDREKDQSYFLYALSPGELDAACFPLGELTKEEVRAIARRHGLVTADKPESQDICFVAGTVQDFLARQGVKEQPGKIVDRDGIAVGEHRGVHHFTVGQRRGLGVSGRKNPLYILEVRPEDQTVVVGESHELERRSFTLHDVHRVAPGLRTNSTTCVLGLAQVRHRSATRPVEVTLTKDGRAQVRFIGETAVVTPGQACVVYDESDTEVLLGGRIARLADREET